VREPTGAEEVMDNINQEATAHVSILHTSCEYHTSQENKKNVTKKVRFAGINFGEITHKIIIEELLKIQLEKFGKQSTE
jgi:hypothetical protein